MPFEISSLDDRHQDTKTLCDVSGRARSLVFELEEIKGECGIDTRSARPLP